MVWWCPLLTGASPPHAQWLFSSVILYNVFVIYIICQRYCCMKTRYGFTVVALKVYVVLACIAVFSVSFQASGISARHRTEVTKRTLPPVPNSMLSPYAFARHPLPLRRNGKDFYVGLRRVRLDLGEFYWHILEHN